MSNNQSKTSTIPTRSNNGHPTIENSLIDLWKLWPPSKAVVRETISPITNQPAAHGQIRIRKSIILIIPLRLIVLNEIRLGYTSGYLPSLHSSIPSLVRILLVLNQ